MTDTPLLQLAKIVAELARVTYDWKDARCVIAEQLVRDLEAAPPPEPARRTITRAQYDDVLDRCMRLRDRNTSSRAAVEHILNTLGLTVEDA